jgi:hypothetical protein
MSVQSIHDFGRVDEKGDAFEFTIGALGGVCRLVAVLQTERGPRRSEVATIPTELWTAVSSATVRELSTEMDETEREKMPPSLQSGLNRLSPLVGRELGVLLIVLMEADAAERVNALLHAWRELAREERWWLYSKAAAPGQRIGVGWRKALFHALSETSETRMAPPSEVKKKLSGSIASPSSQKQTTKALPRVPRRAAPRSTPSRQPQPKRKQSTLQKPAVKTKPTKPSRAILPTAPSRQQKPKKQQLRPVPPSAKHSKLRKTTR